MNLIDKARALLGANSRGAVTLPAPSLYPHQWAWDSAFAAIGWATFDPVRAAAELGALMAGQWSDGRIPHIQFSTTDTPYFPGPEMWGAPRSSSISNPPVWAIAARRVVEAGGPATAIRDLLPAIDRSHQFFTVARDPLGWGGIATCHPWESGLDNSPAWDQPLADVDPELAPPFKRVDNRVVNASERPTDDQYRRFISLVCQIRDCDFGPGPFAVYDPLMTAVAVLAERELAWLGDQLGVETGAGARESAYLSCLGERLWSDELGRYRFYDAAASRFLATDVLSAYVPIIVEPRPERRSALLAGLDDRYSTDWPLPTAPPSAPYYDPVRYWRGPTWLSTNWLLARAPELRDRLRDRSLELVERSGFREYYHPETGEGLGATDFTWSAALALDFAGGA